jgi:hypothetical protein
VPAVPTTTQHSLAGARYGLPAPVFHRLDRASFSWRTSNLDPVLPGTKRLVRTTSCRRCAVSRPLLPAISSMARPRPSRAGLPAATECRPCGRTTGSSCSACDSRCHAAGESLAQGLSSFGSTMTLPTLALARAALRGTLDRTAGRGPRIAPPARPAAVRRTPRVAKRPPSCAPIRCRKDGYRDG